MAEVVNHQGQLDRVQQIANGVDHFISGEGLQSGRLIGDKLVFGSGSELFWSDEYVLAFKKLMEKQAEFTDPKLAEGLGWTFSLGIVKAKNRITQVAKAIHVTGYQDGYRQAAKKGGYEGHWLGKLAEWDFTSDPSGIAFLEEVKADEGSALRAAGERERSAGNASLGEYYEAAAEIDSVAQDLIINHYRRY